MLAPARSEPDKQADDQRLYVPLIRQNGSVVDHEAINDLILDRLTGQKFGEFEPPLPGFCASLFAEYRSVKNISSVMPDRIGAAWPLAVMAVPVVIGATMLGGTVAALLLAAYVAWSGWALSLLFRRQPGDVPRAVVSLIAAVSLYDAVMIAGTGSLWLAALAVAAFGATLMLQRIVPGT